MGDLPTIASQLRKGLLSDEQAIDQLRILMTFADDDDLKRIPILIDDIRKAAAAEAANPAKALVKAAGISGLPMGGASRRAANATLHLTSPETAHTLKFDPSTGSQFADAALAKRFITAPRLNESFLQHSAKTRYIVLKE